MPSATAFLGTVPPVAAHSAFLASTCGWGCGFSWFYGILGGRGLQEVGLATVWNVIGFCRDGGFRWLCRKDTEADECTNSHKGHHFSTDFHLCSPFLIYEFV
jgi:hypothetical protein